MKNNHINYLSRLMICLRRIRYVNPHTYVSEAYATLHLACGEHYLRPCACFRMQRTPRLSRAIATSHGSDGLHALCHPVRLSTCAAVLASDRQVTPQLRYSGCDGLVPSPFLDRAQPCHSRRACVQDRRRSGRAMGLGANQSTNETQDRLLVRRQVARTIPSFEKWRLMSQFSTGLFC